MGFTISIIDRRPNSAIVFSLIGAVLAFFGLMHGEAFGWGVAPNIALVYLCIAGLVAASRNGFQEVRSEP